MDPKLSQWIARLPRPARAAPAGDPLEGTEPPGRPFLEQLRETGLVWRFAALLGAHLLETFFLLTAWVSIGYGALSGRLDRGWLAAWALCLASMIPPRLAATWLQGVVAVGVGGLLKQRLLAGAMTVDSDFMRRRGVGQLLSQVIEAETIERLGASGGLTTLLAAADLLVAGFLFAYGAAPAWQILVFTLWTALTLATAAHNTRARGRWTETRLDLTHKLVEKMSGHRTRLAQQPPEEWHHEEDFDNVRYLAASRRMDRTAALLAAAAPRGYLVAAVLTFAPAFVGTSIPMTQLAITIAAILFAYGALTRFAFGCTRLGAAWVSWRSVKPLFDAASGAVQPGVIAGDSAPTGIVIDAQDIVFSHHARVDPVLKGCHLQVRRGDFLLLEGGSGSGKSTFASLLAGFRQPTSGLILAGGLDWQTLGEEGWRRRVVCAPQYHENHILSAPLAFNLLLGRRYPFTTADYDEARQVCRELGSARCWTGCRGDWSKWWGKPAGSFRKASGAGCSWPARCFRAAT
jgi:ATP-binding cassette subfamily B protein